MLCVMDAQRRTARPSAAEVLAGTARLRRLAGSLQASADRETRWLGAALSCWLHSPGADLLEALDVKPRAGSRETAQTIVRRELQAAALLRLAARAGSDAAALALLRGAPCPPECAAALAEARELGAPTGRNAIGRARARRTTSPDSSR